MSPCLRPVDSAAAAVKLVATSVVRGSHQGESHGGVYLIDLEKREVRQTLDWNKADIDWQGRGWDRGLRGIAFDGETVYIAASDELFAYTPDSAARLLAQSLSQALPRDLGLGTAPVSDFHGLRQHPGLRSRPARVLLGDAREAHHFRFKAVTFDPRGKDGPLMLNKLHVNNVHCTKGGMYLSGLRTGGMLLFNGREVQMSAELPAGSHNARPFRDGVLFNDTEADALRYAGRGEGSEDRAFRSRATIRPRSGTRTWTRATLPARALPAGSASCPTPSSPADRRRRPFRFTTCRRIEAASVNLTMDVRNAIHGLEVWPYG